MRGADVDVQAANALLTQFEACQIFHDFLPENNTYPAIMYTDVTESPVLHADNALYGYEHIVRVTIVTDTNAGINELKDRVFDCMTAAGFMWQNTDKTRNDNEYYTNMDFSIGVWRNV